MTSKDFQSELEKDPFVPFRIHLVSGKTVDVVIPSAAWLLQNAVLIFRNARAGSQKAEGYDVVALRNIERIEQMHGKPGLGRKRSA